MILKICLFLLKSCNACLFSTSSMLSFHQVNSDLLLYSHAMELSFRSFMYTVDAEIVEITATDFISSFTVPHLQATENAFGVILYKNTDNVELDLIFSIIELSMFG